MNALELTGRARSHIVDIDEPRCSLHRDVALPFLTLRAAAASDGIDLIPVSSFRDFDRQLAIWNGKFRGERKMLDRGGAALDANALAPVQKVDAILWWSALPGASRHHWGSEVDVIDAGAMPAGYQPQLEPGEFAPGGVFGKLSAWLDGNAERFGFFRPYRTERGGVQVEPWHLSYAPVAEAALNALTIDVLREVVGAADIAGRDEVLRVLPEIHRRYVCAVDSCG